jgi:splicing factor 3B subunit 1
VIESYFTRTRDNLEISSARVRTAHNSHFRFCWFELKFSRPQLSMIDLDAILPTEGYEIVVVPDGYSPVKTSVDVVDNQGFHIPDQTFEARATTSIPVVPKYTGVGEMPELKMSDLEHFAALLNTEEDDLTPEEAKERKVMAFLLKIKNGSPQMRKLAMKQLMQGAKQLGPAAIFNQILPLLMSTTLEDYERHVLVKVVDRVLHKLGEEVKPFVQKILVVIEPMLIDEDHFARAEGREIISNLSKAVGLPTMLKTMKPDVDHADEYVRNTTAKALAVVANALGISAVLPFLKAVCSSRKSENAKHTGIRIVQQIAIMTGCGVLPYLMQLTAIVSQGIVDDSPRIRKMTALALAALAEASSPYGIECFKPVVPSLWAGVMAHRGDVLSAFLKAIGFIIPLMDLEDANKYTREVMLVLIREFSTPDEEMKRTVLKVVSKCVSTPGVEAAYIRDEVLPPFFRNLWVVRNALDKRNYSHLVETTLSIGKKVGAVPVIEKIVGDLKDGSEAYRKMVLETIHKVVDMHGVTNIDTRLEELLVDGLLYAFQEQSSDDATVVIRGFGVIGNALGVRLKPYLSQVSAVIRWRLNTPSAAVRQQAADLVAQLAPVMKACGEDQMMGHLGLFLYEYLGEEYPDVLGSIIGALTAIVNVVGMDKMNPPVSDLLRRLTPILRNRNEKVQENCIVLVGRIADRGPDLVEVKEWSRICYDLLELLKAQKKAIRRATVHTFGYIAKAIGPHDVIATLLNNLKVQERQLRLCTTIAIGIVANQCGPFTVLPAMMNEYRTPELFVQNGILKSMSFMFEYIGEMGKDYAYAVTPLFEDALIDRDVVHRQTAAWACKHLALGVAGLDCEDALQHLLNYVWPNIFETAPHMIQAFYDAIEALRVALGPGRLLMYVLPGLFHPARRVREAYWRVYNNLYLGGQDALVPFLPRVPDEYGNFARTELDVCL